MINGRERVFGPGDNPFVENSLSGLAREMELAANAYTIMLRSSAGANLHSKKDIKQECDLPETVNIRLIDYKEMCDRNPIANRVVGVLPDECWQSCPLMYEDEDASVSTDFEKAWKDLGKSFVGEESWFESDQEGNPLWEYLHRADKVSGVGHFGLIVLGIDDGKNLDQPIDGFQDPEPNEKSPSSVYVHNARKQRKLIYISVFGENSLQTGGVEYDNNPHSPRYRKPRIYNIDLGDMDTTDSSTMGREDRTVRVHWSRVIHIADNLDSSDIIGTPRQLPVWNNLLALDKIYNGDGESFWKNSSPRTYFETHPQLGGDVSVDIESLRQAVSKMDNGMQKWMFLMGMAAKTVAPQVVDPKSHVDTQIDAICVKLAIPKRIFLGSERGELASGQDDSTWNDRVRARQKKHCIGRIIVPFVNRLIMIGVLPQPKSYKVEWPDPENLKPIEKAQLALTRVDAMSKYIAGGVQQLVDPLDFFVNELDMDEDVAKGQLERAQKAAEDEAEKAAKEQAEAAKQAAANPLQQPQQSPSEQQTPPGQQSPTSPNQKQATQQPPANPQQPTQQVPPKKKTTKKVVTPKSSPPTRNEDEYGSWEELSIQDRIVTVNEDTGEIVSVWTENEGDKPLNKPFRTPSGPKKFGVYTKNDKGNIVLVRFGDSNMEIKRDDKERRKSFRARHGCDTNPGPKWKAKYWSCRMWEKGSSVSDVLNEDEGVENVFCPTGKGGGVDPTCSPGGSRVLSSGEVLQSVTRKDKSWVLGDGTPAPAHIQNMKPPIPPAWKEVHVNLDPEATVLVQGVDTKGRTQSRYSDSHQAKAAAGKFGRVKELRQKRSEIYKELKQDAKDPKLKENAECLELVMKTGIRPGSGDPKADFQAFGATSLKGSHVRVGSEGDVSLVFVPGKSKGKEKVFPVDDPRLSKILQRRAKKAGPDGDLFSTSAGSLRNYSKSKDGGGFKTKDHRTALGTEVAIAEIKKIGPRTKFTSQSEYKKAVKQVAVKVSEVLGNTPNVALKSYIDPTVFSGWKPPKMRKK